MIADLDEVRKCIHLAIEKGAEIKVRRPSPPINTLPLETRLSCDHTIIEEFGGKLKSLKYINDMDGHYLNMGNVAMIIEMNAIATWLITESLKNGVDFAVMRLCEFIKSEYNTVQDVIAVNGIKVSRPILIYNNLEILPYENIKNPLLLEFDITDRFDIGIMNYHILERFKPTAALVFTRKAKPKILDDSTPNGSSNLNELRAICDLLTIVGPCPINPLYEWTQLSDSAPLSGTGAFLSSFFGEILPREEINLDAYEECIGSLMDNYYNLNPAIKTKLKIPLQRLNLSLKRESIVDEAVELRIALESLLITQDEISGISAKLKRRGAWFATSQTKSEIENDLEQIYHYCSEATHNGIIRKEDIVKTQKYIEKGKSYCVHFIKEIVKRNVYPDWVNLGL